MEPYVFFCDYVARNGEIGFLHCHWKFIIHTSNISSFTNRHEQGIFFSSSIGKKIKPLVSSYCRLLVTLGLLTS